MQEQIISCLKFLLMIFHLTYEWYFINILFLSSPVLVRISVIFVQIKYSRDDFLNCLLQKKERTNFFYCRGFPVAMSQSQSLILSDSSQKAVRFHSASWFFIFEYTIRFFFKTLEFYLKIFPFMNFLFPSCMIYVISVLHNLSPEIQDIW
jgi:hypothetical protein